MLNEGEKINYSFSIKNTHFRAKKKKKIKIPKIILVGTMYTQLRP